MGMKFLNKKGWHTGSLRNIENVWKAEQKNEAEQKKLEELRKQIVEERERADFRLLQEQAGLIPKQERLDFLYDSGLSVGKGSSEGFKDLQSYPEKKPENDPASASSSVAKEASSTAAPGALFEDKPQSANDAWRKLHSDPLLMIRQREQEALARVRNNPVQMAMIHKSIESKKQKKTDDRKKSKKHKREGDRKETKKYKREDDRKESKKHRDRSSHRHRHSSPSKEPSDSENLSLEKKGKTNDSNHHRQKYDDYHRTARSDSEDESGRRESRRYTKRDNNSHKVRPSRDISEPESAHERPKYDKNSVDDRTNPNNFRKYKAAESESQYKRRGAAPKLSEEERADRLREMQEDAELHEDQRWKRLKKAEEEDAREAKQASFSGGKNFLDAAQTSVYGAAEKGGSTTIEESVRRRTHYSQGRFEADGGNAFRR